MAMKPACPSEPMIGAPTTPASAASIMPMTQAQRDVVRSLIPRVLARSARSTTALIWSPSDVWLSNSHRPTATTAAVTRIASSSELNGTSNGRCQVSAGVGPMPGGRPTWVMLKLWTETSQLKMLTSWSFNQVTRAGIAISRPTVAMIFADSVARAEGRNTATSRSSPSSGANTRMTSAAAGMIGMWRLVLSW